MRKITDNFVASDDFRRIAVENHIENPDEHVGVQMALSLRDRFAKLNAKEKPAAVEGFLNPYFYENRVDNGEFVNAIMDKKMNQDEIRICIEMVLSYLVIATSYFSTLRDAKFMPDSRYQKEDNYAQSLRMESYTQFRQEYEPLFYKANPELDLKNSLKEPALWITPDVDTHLSQKIMKLDSGEYIQTQSADVNHNANKTDELIDDYQLLVAFEDLPKVKSGKKEVFTLEGASYQPLVAFDDLAQPLSTPSVSAHSSIANTSVDSVEVDNVVFGVTSHERFVSDIYTPSFVEKIDEIDKAFMNYFSAGSSYFIQYEGREVFITGNHWLDSSPTYRAEGIGAISLFNHFMLNKTYTNEMEGYAQVMHASIVDLTTIKSLEPEYLPVSESMNMSSQVVDEKIKKIRDNLQADNTTDNPDASIKYF